ncbi:hypothetical protein K2X30_15270, partial [bacterium]|nr:hypothetical protein [bacterium]
KPSFTLILVQTTVKNLFLNRTRLKFFISFFLEGLGGVQVSWKPTSRQGTTMGVRQKENPRIFTDRIQQVPTRAGASCD